MLKEPLWNRVLYIVKLHHKKEGKTIDGIRELKAELVLHVHTQAQLAVNRLAYKRRPS
jgi:hypothetical protein